jgi:uncharacterized protein (TIGR02300 family)
MKTTKGKNKETIVKLGNKHKCFKCGTKFYDLEKPEAICPKCGENMKNEEEKKEAKRKRRRMLGRPKDAREFPEAKEDAEATKAGDLGEYILDMEDIILEESEEASEK